MLVLLATAAAATTARSDANITRPGSVFGPDVSHYQGHVSWEAVKAAGASFAFAKASEGLTMGDDQFASNWRGIKAAGIGVRGAYHFGHPEEDAAAQARHFMAQLTEVGPGDLLVLDIEIDRGQSPTAVAKWCDEYLTAVTVLSGLPSSRVLVYTGAWFWDPKVGATSVAGKHPLWVSGYVSAPPMPTTWAQWTYWQYTDKATDCGIPSGADCSVFHGTAMQLHGLAGLA